MMPTLEFTPSGESYPMHYKMLREFAKNFPRGPKYAPLARDILALNIDSISSLIIRNSELDSDTYDDIWLSANLLLRRELLDKAEFVKLLSDGQAQDIITMRDAVSLVNLVKHGEELFGDKRRISGEWATKLLEFARGFDDLRVSRALARNRRLPVRFCPPLTEQLLYEIPPQDLRFTNMTSADVDMLDSLDSAAMLSLVKGLASIKDQNVQNAVLKFFVDNPDPGMRLIFAEHAGRYAKWTKAMREGLEKLTEDSEPDVAWAAISSGEAQWR